VLKAERIRQIAAGRYNKFRFSLLKLPSGGFGIPAEKLIVGRYPEASGQLVESRTPVYVYILQSSGGRYYIGSTSELELRLNQHNDATWNPSIWTRSRGPWKLVFSKQYSTRAAAIRAEALVKRMKSRVFIEKLISGEYRLDPDESGCAHSTNSEPSV
jgi:putative endonuclease